MTTEALAVPPYSIDAEQSVLGALLLDNQAWDKLGALLVEDDFYRHEHRVIFAAITSLLNRCMPADVLTVHDRLCSQGHAESAGGLPYLNAVTQSVPSSANVRRYAEIVRSHRVRRDVLAVGHEIAAIAADDVSEADTLVERATGMVMGLADDRAAGRDAVPIGDLLHGFVEALDERFHRGGGISGLATGFPDLDDKTSGLQDGDLIIIAGRPSMGKTTLALNIGENVCAKGLVAMVVSLEMSADQLTERSVSRAGGIDSQRLRNGKLSQDDWARLTHSITQLQDQRLIIADDPGLAKVSRIRLAARKVKQKHGQLNLLVIDYLQLMQGEGNNRNEELSGITRALKILARELGCPVIVLSQLSREVEKRVDKRPILSDLRESGAIEQDADVVLMAYRDDYYKPDSPFKGLAEILIRKQRMGPLGEVFMVFQGQYSRFLPADAQQVAEARNSAPTRQKATYGGLRD